MSNGAKVYLMASGTTGFVGVTDRQTHDKKDFREITGISTIAMAKRGDVSHKFYIRVVLQYRGYYGDRERD